MKKNVQISWDLFFKLWLFHTQGIQIDDDIDFIKSELTLKMAKIQEHNRYTRFYNGDKSAWFDPQKADEELLKMIDEMKKVNKNGI